MVKSTGCFYGGLKFSSQCQHDGSQLSFNSSARVLNAFFWPLWAASTYMVYIHTCRKNIHAYKNKSVFMPHNIRSHGISFKVSAAHWAESHGSLKCDGKHRSSLNSSHLIWEIKLFKGEKWDIKQRSVWLAVAGCGTVGEKVMVVHRSWGDGAIFQLWNNFGISGESAASTQMVQLLKASLVQSRAWNQISSPRQATSRSPRHSASESSLAADSWGCMCPHSVNKGGFNS